MKNIIFDRVKSLNMSAEDLRELMEGCGVKFKGKTQFHCPFHGEDTNASGSIKANGGAPFFKCFACDAGGDAIKFYEKMLDLSPVEAAKKVLAFMGDSFDPNSDKESAEQLEKMRELAKNQAEARAKNEEIEHQKAIKNMTAKTPALLEAMSSQNISDFIDIFPHQSENFKLYASEYLGYSADHNSLAIIIKDFSGNTKNIKIRNRYEWDAQNKCFSTERKAGKWLSEYGAKASPFPLSAFRTSSEERVIICEGEKDALNLLSWGANVLTLGGVTNSWEPFLEYLKNRDVYIWFDNDSAGYVEALNRYKEIVRVARSCYVVLFFKHNSHLSAKYDISDFLKDNKQRLLAGSSVYDLIAFFSFKLNNDVLNEIGDYINDDRVKEHYEISRLKDFGDITGELMATDCDGKYINILPVKGEMDDNYIDAAINAVKRVTSEHKEAYNAFKKNLIATQFNIDDSEIDKILEALDKMATIQKTMRSNYHQTHIVDMVNSFNGALNRLGYFLGEYQGRLYLWNGVYYMPIINNSLEKFIANFWMQVASVDMKKRVKQNSEQIMANLMLRADDLDYIRQNQLKNVRVINLLNGALIFNKNGKYMFKEAHERNMCATNILNFKYNKNAKCPKWRTFLNQVMSDEKDQATLMEFIGYCFLPSHDYESFLFLYGKSGANGKSVILDVIRSFFGEDNVSNLQLQQLCGHELDILTNKILNIGSEIDKAGADKGLNTLKALVSPRDYISINPKNRDAYNLTPENKPKFAFAGNEKPKVAMDNGVFRRMLLLNFDKEIKDDQKIRGLSERFSDELDGILNMAIEGLVRLVKNGRFTKSERMNNMLEEYKDEVNPIRGFIKNSIVAHDGAFIPNKYLYAIYKQYSDLQGNHALAQRGFFSRFREELKMAGINYYDDNRRISGTMPGLNAVEKGIGGIRFNYDSDCEGLHLGSGFVDIRNLIIF